MSGTSMIAHAFIFLSFLLFDPSFGRYLSTLYVGNRLNYFHDTSLIDSLRTDMMMN